MFGLLQDLKESTNQLHQAVFAHHPDGGGEPIELF